MADIRIAPASIPVTTPTAPPPITTRGGGEGFSDTLKNAVSAVNEAQLDARDATVAMASGSSGVDSAQALVTIEKANVSFQFAMQIRNKLLEAYQEVMRMQV